MNFHQSLQVAASDQIKPSHAHIGVFDMPNPYKDKSIRYFININILQNPLIDIFKNVRYYTANFHQSSQVATSYQIKPSHGSQTRSKYGTKYSANRWQILDKSKSIT